MYTLKFELLNHEDVTANNLVLLCVGYAGYKPGYSQLLVDRLHCSLHNGRRRISTTDTTSFHSGQVPQTQMAHPISQAATTPQCKGEACMQDSPLH